VHNQDFVKWLQSLLYQADLNSQVTIPSYISTPDTIKGLISKIYPQDLLLDVVHNCTVFADYTIFSTRNDTVQGLNIAILV